MMKQGGDEAVVMLIAAFMQIGSCACFVALAVLGVFLAGVFLGSFFRK
jgi:hypothetical protein